MLPPDTRVLRVARRLPACCCAAAIFAVLVCLLPIPASAQGMRDPVKALPLEGLMQVDVTSVSRRLEPMSEAPAAVEVITGEEIRRSGATTLVEALRLAAGLFVARSDGRTWAVTARGFANIAANKLLVLIDGRTVFSPLFSGVFWEVQDVPLGEVDRIEVIRGPGATLWGANAVNGVINVITKPAGATIDSRVTAGAGDEERLFGSARYGDTLGASGHYRVYAKYVYLDANRTQTGEPARDPLRRGQVGARVDWTPSPRSQVTIQGDAYRGAAGLFDRPDSDVRGGNLLARWRIQLSEAAELQVQGYYDRAFLSLPLLFEEDRGTWDVDVQYRRVLGRRHLLLAGGGYRLSRDSTTVPVEPDGPQAIGLRVFFDPPRRSDSLVGAFVQDDITLLPGRLFVTLGARVDRNPYSGAELQPTVRARWHPDPRMTIWGAVTRAVRTPTRLDSDVRYERPDGSVLLRGNPAFESESLVAYEAGYRLRPLPALSLNVSAYHNRYDRLRSQFPGPPIELRNDIRGTTRGLELEGAFQPAEWLEWQASWTLFDKELRVRPGGVDPTGGAPEGNDPGHLFGLRGAVNLPHGVELDAALRRVGALPSPPVPAYTELDLRAGWWITSDFEISLIGRNLLHDRHPEFGPPHPRRVEFERSLYGRISVLF